jgi:hypothetical protein
MIQPASLILAATTAIAAAAPIELVPIGRYDSGIRNASAAEIVAFDHDTARLFVTNASANRIDVIDIVDPTTPILARTIDLSPYGAGVNSVSIKHGLVACAVEAAPKHEPGSIVLFDTDAQFIAQITAGALPDMVAFSPDGRFLLAANEGEPSDDYTIDPPGSITIVRLPDDPRTLDQSCATTAGFTLFDTTGVPRGVRVFGPGATPSTDLEPEYIAFDSDSRRAYVSCQENNAIAVVDLALGLVIDLFSAGTLDHSQPENALDPSDADGGINITTAPVLGMRQPDTIACYRADGRDYIVTANEGDPRGYASFEEQTRVKDLTLDPIAFPDRDDLQRDERLGRLRVSGATGDTDDDGDHDELHAFGSRSISIFDRVGNLVSDTGSLFERTVARLDPDRFNINERGPETDTRSDDRGPEPEALALGRIGDRVYAFVGLERTSAIIAVDITDPARPEFASYYATNKAGGPEGAAGDIAPEGMSFIDSSSSPVGAPLLVVTNEVSGTTLILRIDAPDQGHPD